MIFIIAISRDRQPRSFRFRIQPGINQPPVAQSRACASGSAARREAERVFGPLVWQDAGEAGVIGQEYVTQVARCETK